MRLIINEKSLNNYFSVILYVSTRNKTNNFTERESEGFGQRKLLREFMSCVNRR